MILKHTIQPRSLLEFILPASILSTAVHYTDNYLFINKYPQPHWITLPGIYVSWLILTAIGLVGYWLYRKEKFFMALACLLVYSLTGLSSLAHYFYGAMSEFSMKMHFFILTDGLTGLAVLAFTIRSGLFLIAQYSKGS